MARRSLLRQPIALPHLLPQRPDLLLQAGRLAGGCEDCQRRGGEHLKSGRAFAVRLINCTCARHQGAAPATARCEAGVRPPPHAPAAGSAAAAAVPEAGAAPLPPRLRACTAAAAACTPAPAAGAASSCRFSFRFAFLAAAFALGVGAAAARRVGSRVSESAEGGSAANGRLVWQCADNQATTVDSTHRWAPPQTPGTWARSSWPAGQPTRHVWMVAGVLRSSRQAHAAMRTHLGAS